jgi:signal transduction histidine kinase
MVTERLPLRWEWPLRRFAWLELAWIGFALVNLVGMLLFPAWETVPFHFIWVSLTLMYGFRVWGTATMEAMLVGVVALTAAVLLYEVSHGEQLPDELTEVPLMAAMFLAMVWHARRRLVAMADLERVSEENLRLLQRERQFIQDASHELRTPITIALGHAELVARTSSDPEHAEDARIVVDELQRLRRLADRLLLLAASGDPDFLSRTPVPVGRLLADVHARWALIERRWVLGAGAPACVLADPDRLGTALDALVENAVKRTAAGGEIRLSARRAGASVVISVADSGPGIPGDQLDRIFDRFARLDTGRNRNGGGLGLGLAIVRAIAEAHGGTARVRSSVGKGSVFQIVLPASDGAAEAATR